MKPISKLRSNLKQNKTKKKIVKQHNDTKSIPTEKDDEEKDDEEKQNT